MLIRPAKRGDKAFLVQSWKESIEASFPGREVPEKEAKESLKHSKGKKYIIEVKGKPLGHIILSFEKCMGEIIARIVSIGIDNKYKKKGYASKALEWAEAQAREKGASKITADISLCNTPSLCLFKKKGFSEERIEVSKKI